VGTDEGGVDYSDVDILNVIRIGNGMENGNLVPRFDWRYWSVGRGLTRIRPLIAIRNTFVIGIVCYRTVI
jgi:hypothetical protein